MQLRTEAEAHVAEASVAREAAEKDLAAALEKLTAEETLATNMKRRSSLLQRRTQLNGEQKKIVTLEAALRTNQEAKQVLPRVEALEKAERAVKEANQSLERVSPIAPEAVNEGSIGVTEEEVTRLASAERHACRVGESGACRYHFAS